MAGQRDGSNKLVLLAKALISLVVAWQAQILKNFPDNVAIRNLIEAILALIPLLALAEADLVAFDGENAGILDDPTTIPGYGGGTTPGTPEV